MATKYKVGRGEPSALNKTENTELIVHRVVSEYFQRYITTVNLVITLAAVIGVGSYIWVFNSMVDRAVSKVRFELAIQNLQSLGWP